MKNNKNIIKSLFKKELLEVFRDKKTVIMMLIVPVVIYPLMFIVGIQAMNMIANSQKERAYYIVLDCEDDGRLEKLIQKKCEGDGYKLFIKPKEEIEDYSAAVADEMIDVYVKTETVAGKLSYSIYYLSASDDSGYAADVIADYLDEMKQNLTKDVLSELSLDADKVLNPIEYKFSNVATGEQKTGSVLGTIIPFMLIVSIMMGTMYPAIDTTAGERERGTLETVLTLPVTNRQLIMSKFFTVALIGVISAALNLISMGFIGWYMLKLMAENGTTTMESVNLVSFIPAIIITVIAIFVFALFISAITMCFTVFASSYKEANNYITPLMLVIMFASFVGFIPNVTLTGGVALIPVANIALMIKNILLFKIDMSVVALVLLTNIIYAMISVVVLSKIYDSEAVLFGGQRNGIQIFEKRSNLKKGGVPTTADAAFLLLITLVLIIYVGGFVQLKYGLWGVLITQLIIFAMPMGILIYTKRNLKLTYSFNKTGVLSYAGGLIMMLGAMLVGIVLTNLLGMLAKSSYENDIASMEAIFDKGIIPSILVIALAPALFEEMFFRGFILAAVRERFGKKASIIIVALSFGIYHMSITKIPVTALLGAVLCYVVYKSGSIFPAMLMHFTNNLISVLSSYYPEKISKLLPFINCSTIGEGASLIGLGIVMFAAGLIIFNQGNKERTKAIN